MTDLGQTKLVLFFTRGVSLRTWGDIGMLDREAAIYQLIRPHVQDITFVTYGNASDLHYAKQLDGIRVICNKWNLPNWFYVMLISRIYPLLWRGVVVMKSNQVHGADVALKTALRFRKKFIARCGYLPSNIAMWRHGGESDHVQRERKIEDSVFGSAGQVVVTTSAIRETIVERYGVEKEKVRIIPNYVDTLRFRPLPVSRQKNLLCCVGRLEAEKNIEALFDAINGLDVELAVIGGGSLKGALIAKAEKDRLLVQFLGNVPNVELPAHLNRASAFILPSHIEHHPKVVLEAMACGLPVIGANVPGIRELIVHRETGYLCDTSPQGIKAAIGDVLADLDLRARMGRNAREFVVEHFALEKIVEMELALLRELIA